MVEIVSNNAPYYVRQSHFDNDRMAGSVPVWKNTENAQNASSASSLSITDQDKAQANITPPSLSFGELLDVINPLQHLPIVSNVYRGVTGDEISAVARIGGGALYGGALGGVAALVSAAIEEHSGQSVVGALTSNTNKTPYFIQEEERSAGFRKNRETLAKTSHQISHSSDVFEQLANTKRQPVTQVEVAQNTNTYTRGFNS